MSSGSASGFWIEFERNSEKRDIVRPKLDEQGRLVLNFSSRRFVQSFPPIVLKNDCNIRWLIKLLATRFIKYVSDIISYEITTDGQTFKIHVELESLNGVQHLSQVHSEGETLSGSDASGNIQSKLESA